MNLRPHGPEPCALPNCATPRSKNIEFSNSGQNCGQPPFLRGFETTRSRFFSSFLAFSRFFEGGRSVRPLAPEPSALPNCATPRLGYYLIFLYFTMSEFEPARPFRKYSRRASLDSLAPSTPYFRDTLHKNNTQLFLLAHPWSRTKRTTKLCHTPRY